MRRRQRRLIRRLREFCTQPLCRSKRFLSLKKERVHAAAAWMPLGAPLSSLHFSPLALTGRWPSVAQWLIGRTLYRCTHTRMMIYRQANGEENNTRVPTPASDEKGACHMVTGMTLHTCHIIFSYKWVWRQIYDHYALFDQLRAREVFYPCLQKSHTQKAVYCIGRPLNLRFIWKFNADFVIRVFKFILQYLQRRLLNVGFIYIYVHPRYSEHKK